MNLAGDEKPQDQDDANDEVIGRAFKQSLAVIGVIVFLVLGVIVVSRWKTQDQQEFVVEAAEPTKRSALEQPIPQIPLTDVTDEWAVDFVHQSGRRGDRLLPETMGGGVAIFDANRDGNLDLFCVNSQVWPWDATSEKPIPMPADGTMDFTKGCRLFLGDGAGHFEDVSALSGLNIDVYGMGATAADIDNDGDTDLFVTAVGRNRLFRNEGSAQGPPRFVDITDQSDVGGDAAAWSTSAGFADFDNDGLLDLFVCNYVTWDRDVDLGQSFTLDGVSRAYGPPRAFAGSFSYLYHNEGEGRFADVSEEAGIQIVSPDTEVPLGKAMGVTFADVNGDGYQDIVVANDTVPNFLFENQRDGTFREIGRLAGIAFDRSGAARGAMGIDCSYMRNDETLAIGIGNFANEPSALYMSRPGRNQFVDAAMFTGFGPPTRVGLTFGLLFTDLDLDGRHDVLGANGHLEAEINRTQSTQHYAQSPQVFWNAGRDAAHELVLLNRDQLGDSFLKPMVARGAACGDLDNDGDPDLVLVGSHSRARVFRNDQELGHHWLRLRLVGSQCNRDGIGSIVTVTLGDTLLKRCLNTTKSYLSCSPSELLVGLGKHLGVTRVHVHWPSGDTEHFETDRLGRVWTLRLGDGVPGP
ncbi:MAG: CRTAC1 family protein [Planctomycetota bacterium]